MSVSHASLDSDLKGVDLVKNEAIAISRLFQNGVSGSEVGK